MLNPKFKFKPPRINRRHPNNYRFLPIALLLISSNWLSALPLLAASPGTVINNQATGSYTDPTDNSEKIFESNTVKVTIGEIAGITVNGIGTEEADNSVNNTNPNQGNNQINPDDIVYFKYKITNVGNDPTQFFIPDAPSSIINGTKAGDIEIIEYDPDGENGATQPTVLSSPVKIPNGGISTGDTNALDLPNGSIPPNGTVTIRVPIKVNSGVNDNDKVTVVMGDTDPANAQNQAYSGDATTKDIYTQDNEDADNIPDEVNGTPLNGDETNHRQEASASQDVTVTKIILNSVSGTLYEDSDGGDDLDPNEPKLPADITVNLLDSNDNVIATTTTQSDGTYIFTDVADGSYKIQVDINDSEIPSKYGLGTQNDIEITVSGAAVTDQNFGFDVYEVSPDAGKVIINEILYRQNGNSAATNDEFIEIYNASTSAVDLTGWKLMDGNIIANDTDGSSGSINGNSGFYEFPNGTTLEPGEYAVIWIGDNTNTPDRKATGAKFQAWLGNAPKLNNTGDDMWLYDRDTKIVDYIAYGSADAINTPPPTSLNLWDSTHQTALAGADTGQSISLTKNGLDGNTSACWEPTTSGNAQTQGCANYLPTIDSDNTQSRVTSAGGNNNGTPNVLLVKRITAINGQTTNPNDNTTPLNTVVDDTDSPRQDDDNHPNWTSDYLKGAINGGSVKPNDELEYTIYFLSAGSTPARSVLFCDRVPENVAFIPNSFNGEANQAAGGLQNTDRGILWLKNGNTESLTNAQDDDFAQYFPPGDEPSNVYPNIKCDGLNTNGAVVVNLEELPNANAPGTPNTSYGFIKFRGRVK